MPAIRGQTVLPDGYEIDTVEFGKRRIHRAVVDNDVINVSATLTIT